jgi:hypothetical protein
MTKLISVPPRHKTGTRAAETVNTTGIDHGQDHHRESLQAIVSSKLPGFDLAMTP